MFFQIAVEIPSLPRIDLGAQSGNETQYLFCDGDVRHSNADVVKQFAASKVSIAHSIRFCWIILTHSYSF